MGGVESIVIEDTRYFFGFSYSEDAVLSPLIDDKQVMAEFAAAYMKQRDGVAHDALWGLVRVEVAECEDVTARADEVSRWLLAERTPLALPDGRWDRLAYPVRECQEVLRAIT